MTMASLQKHQQSAQSSSTMDSIEPASLLEANLRAGVTSESHLQSLGFVMDNGRPRFKIDEPVGAGASGMNSLRSASNTMRPNPNSMDSEEESFVVLGKDSLCSIQASALASYAEIQKRSISTDYNSIISSLTAEEAEKKLKELLQENVKLKDTLNQNNLAMKRQFNTLAAWQEEITKVHQNHKQKFSETKELISQLRKENSELKIKASGERVATSDHSSKVKELEEQLQKTVLAQKEVQTAREVELEKANCEILKELEESKSAYEAINSDNQRYRVLSTRLSQQLKQADQTIAELKLERSELNLKEKEQLSSLADYSLLAASSKQKEESEIDKEKNRRQEKEVEHLKELIHSLEEQLKVTSQNSFPSIEIRTGDNCSRLPSQDRIQFVKNVTQYNEILKKLSQCYTKQGSSYVNVQECLRESIDTIEDIEKMKINKDAGVSHKEIEDKLANCRARLKVEQLEMINERQELIKAQNQFQKVFSDYNSVLYELEIMQEENTKLNCLQNKKQEILEISTQMQEDLAKGRKLLEESEANLLKERSDLLKEKKAAEAAQSTCDSLTTALNRQKLLQEAEQKSFLAERMARDEKIKDLKQRNENLEETLKSNAEEIEGLKTEIKTLKESLEKLPLLEAQNQGYEEDFREERSARQQLTVEKNQLLDEFKKLQTMHKELVATLNKQQTSQTYPRQPMPQTYQQQQQQQQQQRHHQPSASAPPRSEADPEGELNPIITAFSCPKCSLTFTAIRPLQEHVEECLQLQ